MRSFLGIVLLLLWVHSAEAVWWTNITAYVQNGSTTNLTGTWVYRGTSLGDMGGSLGGAGALGPGQSGVVGNLTIDSTLGSGLWCRAQTTSGAYWISDNFEIVTGSGQYITLTFAGGVSNNVYRAVSTLINDSATGVGYRIYTNGVFQGLGYVTAGRTASVTNESTGAWFPQVITITGADGQEITDASWTTYSTNTSPPVPVYHLVSTNTPVPTYNGGTSNIVWGTNATMAGDSAIYSALVQIGNQAHSDATRIVNAVVGTGTNSGGGSGTNVGSGSWTNGLTAEQFAELQWTNGIVYSGMTNALARQFEAETNYNDLVFRGLTNRAATWVESHSEQMGDSTNAVGAGGRALDGFVRDNMGEGWTEPGEEQNILVYPISGGGKSVASVTVRTDSGPLASVAGVCRAVITWLIASLFFIQCSMWAATMLTSATGSPQGTSAGQVPVVSGISAFILAVVIVAGLAALPTIGMAVINTFVGGTGSVASLRPNFEGIMGSSGLRLLLKFFPLGMFITVMINYPLAKFGIAYVGIVYAAAVRLLSGI